MMLVFGLDIEGYGLGLLLLIRQEDCEKWKGVNSNRKINPNFLFFSYSSAGGRFLSQKLGRF